MTKERLHYIDVAKGLLILMVVWGHYELMCRLCYGIKDPIIDRLDSVEMLWVSFFMPAFFFISGLCSNFRKPFIPFFTAGLKTLLIPAIVINYGTSLIEYLSWGESPVWIIKTIGKSFLLKCAGEWFIPSMFISRLVVWGLVRLGRTDVRILISLLLLIVGVWMYDYSCLPEIWAYKHALMVVIFMLVGNIVKIDNITVPKILNWIYWPLLLVVIFSGCCVPYITNRVCVTMWQIPIVFILAVTGTFMILAASRRIGACSMLEFLRRNSLVIYLAHFIFYRAYLSLVAGWFNGSVLMSVVLFLGLISVNIISCCILAYVLNMRYMRWILGKF